MTPFASSPSEYFSLSSGVTRRQCQAERLDDAALVFAASSGLLLGARLLLVALLELADLDLDRGFPVLAPDGDRHGLVDRRLGHQSRQAPHVADRLAVKAQDDVARLDAGGLRRPVVGDAGDQRAARLVEPEALGDLVGHRLDPHAEPAAMHGVIGLALELGDDRLGERGGDCETDPDRAAGGREDRRIDADDLAVHVEHRPAGIAAIDRGVGLQEIVIGAGVDVALAGRQDARRDAAAEPEWIADRQHPVADARRIAVAPGRRGSAACRC